MADGAHTTLHGAGLLRSWRTVIERARDDEEGEIGREEKKYVTIYSSTVSLVQLLPT